MKRTFVIMTMEDTTQKEMEDIIYTFRSIKNLPFEGIIIPKKIETMNAKELDQVIKQLKRLRGK